jgi:hypothetical protein
MRFWIGFKFGGFGELGGIEECELEGLREIGAKTE